MSLRGSVGTRYVIARSAATKQSLALVDMDRDGEIAAASRGWPRNDMDKRAWDALKQEVWEERLRLFLHRVIERIGDGVRGAGCYTGIRTRCDHVVSNFGAGAAA